MDYNLLLSACRQVWMVMQRAIKSNNLQLYNWSVWLKLHFFLDFESFFFFRIFDIWFKQKRGMIPNFQIRDEFCEISKWSWVSRSFFWKIWRYFGEALQNFIRLKSLLLVHFYSLLLSLSLFLFGHHLQYFLLCFSAFRLPKWKLKSLNRFMRKSPLRKKDEFNANFKLDRDQRVLF